MSVLLLLLLQDFCQIFTTPSKSKSLQSSQNFSPVFLLGRHKLSLICPVKALHKSLEVSGKCFSFCLRIQKCQKEGRTEVPEGRQDRSARIIFSTDYNFLIDYCFSLHIDKIFFSINVQCKKNEIFTLNKFCHALMQCSY